MKRRQEAGGRGGPPSPPCPPPSVPLLAPPGLVKRHDAHGAPPERAAMMLQSMPGVGAWRLARVCARPSRAPCSWAAAAVAPVCDLPSPSPPRHSRPAPPPTLPPILELNSPSCSLSPSNTLSVCWCVLLLCVQGAWSASCRWREPTRAQTARRRLSRTPWPPPAARRPPGRGCTARPPGSSAGP